MTTLFLFLAVAAIPAQVVPAQTITITVPKNGGKMSITIPAQTLPAQPVPPMTFNFSCTGPDMQHLTCTTVAK